MFKVTLRKMILYVIMPSENIRFVFVMPVLYTAVATLNVGLGFVWWRCGEPNPVKS
jgi:hypothetical protein